MPIDTKTLVTAGALAVASAVVYYFLRAGGGGTSSARDGDDTDAATQSSAAAARGGGKRKPGGNRRQARAITVTQLYVFPVKGCSGSKVNRVQLVETGAKYDREWAIVSCATGNIMTQRDHPKMRRIVAGVDEHHGALLLNARSLAGEEGAGGTGPYCRPPLVFSMEHTLKRMEARRERNLSGNTEDDEGATAGATDLLPVTLWGVSGVLFDEGDAAAAWLSEFLGTKCRLGRIFVHRRPATSVSHAPITRPSDVVSMQDFSTLHIITEEGVAWIRAEDEAAKRQAAASDSDNNNGDVVDVLRFRPNIVVSGAPFPEEDDWKSLRIAGVDIRVAKHCGRCSVPTILSDGTRDKTNGPTQQLRRTRNAYYIHQVPMADLEGRQRWPMFGLNVFHVMPHGGSGGAAEDVFLNVGDAVEVLEYSDETLEFE